MRDDSNGNDVPNGRPGPFGLPTNARPTNGRPANGLTPNGFARPGGHLTRLPTGGDEAPLDLVAVQADDELVTALAARTAVPVGGPPMTAEGRDAGGRGTDDRLAVMLAAWRAEIDAEPIPELVDLDAAVAAVVAGVRAQEAADRRKRAGRVRQLAPLAAAAAIILATVGGVGLGSQNAVPGDTLWAIQKVVNPERAESVEAKVEVETRLQKVRAALAKGDTTTAAQELEAIRTQIPAVRGQEGQPQLTQEQEFLAAKLADTPPGTPADLATPPKSNPAARSTGTPAAPPAPGVPPVDPAVTAPSASQSVTDPQPTDSDPRSGPGPVDPRSVPVVPVEPGGPDPVRPKPSPPDADVTSAPEIPKPDPRPDPTGPAGGSGGTEGGVDPTTRPDPVDPPPPSGADEGAGEEPATSSDTTAAAGSAGASIATTATDTTS